MNNFKKKVTMFTAMLAFMTVSCAAVNAAANVGMDTTAGHVYGSTNNVGISSTSKLTNVAIKDGKGGFGQVDWKNFNVQKGERVNFEFSNNSQTILNRVLGGQESKILGQMTNSCAAGTCTSYVQTSKVILINPAGIMFGAGSQVDLNSFTASTFDFKGAKNIQSMTESELSSYQANVLNKMSPLSSVNGGTENTGYIKFDSNYTDAFKAAGIDMSKFEGKTLIRIGNYDENGNLVQGQMGANFGHFKTDANGNLTSEYADSNPNKTVNMVSDNIVYRDSLIRTGGNNNYVMEKSNFTASNSNVRLITADGVTFGYVSNGYSNADKEKVESDSSKHSNVVRQIDMDNSGLGKNTPAIESGDIRIQAKSSAAGSKVKVKETYLKADKLLNQVSNGNVSPINGGEYGNIKIISSGGADVEDSILESANTQLNGRSTLGQAGGEIQVKAGDNANVKNTLIKSAGVDKSKYNDEKYIYNNNGVNTSGRVTISSENLDANIEGTRILSQEEANISANRDINFDNSLLSAKSSVDGGFKDANFNAKNQINIHNGAISADNIGLDATASGTVKISSTSNSTSYASGNVKFGQDKSLLKAQKDININANDTTIDNSSLAYNNLSLVNDVTVKGNVTLTPNSGKDLNIQTNGNLTFDNADVMYGEKAEINVNADDSYNVNVKGSKADNLTGRSTAGTVFVKNNSNLNASKDINLISDNSTLQVDNSKITAGNNVNTSAKDGNGIFNSKINATKGDINIESKDNMALVYDNSALTAGKDININSKSSSTVKESTLNAGNNANVNSVGSVFADNSNINAGNDINLISSTGGSTVNGASKLTANNDVNIVAKTMANIQGDNSTVIAKNNVNISGDNQALVTNSTVEALTGDITMNSNNGDTFVDNSKLTAGNHITAKGKNVNVDKSNIIAGSDKDGFDIVNDSKDEIGDISFEATAGNVNISDSSITSQDNDVNIKSTGATNIDKSDINAPNDVNVDAGKIKVKDSTVNAKGNNASLISNGSGDNGNIEVTNSNVEAGNDVTVKSKNGKDVKISNSNIIAGSDAEGFDKVKDTNDVIGNVNIEATAGSVHITDGSKIESQDNDVNITSKDTIAFGTDKNITPDVQIKGANNVNVKSTAGDITAEKTDMGDIEYGNRLTFDAAGDNIFTSADSLKSVNVDYKAGGANRIYTTDDAQFVNSTFEAPNNFVESGGDVILNNHEIKQATPDAKDTKTQIFANGNVTTDNVTNEDLNAKGGTFPQSVDYNGTAFGPEGSNTTLNINQTKLTVETQTVRDEANPDNGSIKLDVENADNPNAGLDLVAKNVDNLEKDPTGGYHKPGYFKAGESKWDENIKEHQGPEVHLNATDDVVSIANIETDKLTLSPNDTKVADKTNGTPKIEVKDQGGFNLDPELDYNPDKTGDGYTYDKTIKYKDKQTTGGDLTMGDWSDWETVSEEKRPDGSKVITEERTRDGEVSDKITTKIDQEHKITFDNDGNPSEFTLIYDKKDTTVEPGYELKAEDVRTGKTPLPDVINPETDKPVKVDDFVDTNKKVCPAPPTVEPEADSLVDRVTLPREITETSKTSKITDNTVDQSDNVMSAAAKVDISEDGENSAEEDIDEETEE